MHKSNSRNMFREDFNAFQPCYSNRKEQNDLNQCKVNNRLLKQKIEAL